MFSVIQTGLGMRLTIQIKWGSKCLSRKHFKLIPMLLQAMALECVILTNVQNIFDDFCLTAIIPFISL